MSTLPGALTTLKFSVLHLQTDVPIYSWGPDLVARICQCRRHDAVIESYGHISVRPQESRPKKNELNPSAALFNLPTPLFNSNRRARTARDAMTLPSGKEMGGRHGMDRLVFILGCMFLCVGRKGYLGTRLWRLQIRILLKI